MDEVIPDEELPDTPDIPELPPEEVPEVPVDPEYPTEEELILAEKISLLALMIGDIPGGPYYPMFTEAQYKQFLTLGRGNVNKSAVYAAMSASFFVSGESSREVIGELQISNSTGANYLKLLDYLIATSGKIPPDNLMPWFAGAKGCDKNKLLDFRRCDGPFRWQHVVGDPCSVFRDTC